MHLTRKGMCPEIIGRSGSSPRSKVIYEVRNAETRSAQARGFKAEWGRRCSWHRAYECVPFFAFTPRFRKCSTLRMPSRRRIVRAQDEPACDRFGEGFAESADLTRGRNPLTRRAQRRSLTPDSDDTSAAFLTYRVVSS